MLFFFKVGVAPALAAGWAPNPIAPKAAVSKFGFAQLDCSGGGGGGDAEGAASAS